MSQQRHAITARSRRDQCNVMREEFEKYEQSLYPSDSGRLARCKVTGKYTDTAVQYGFDDWRKAWHTATTHARNSFKRTAKS